MKWRALTIAALGFLGVAGFAAAEIESSFQENIQLAKGGSGGGGGHGRGSSDGFEGSGHGRGSDDSFEDSGRRVRGEIRIFFDDRGRHHHGDSLFDHRHGEEFGHEHRHSEIEIEIEDHGRGGHR